MRAWSTVALAAVLAACGPAALPPARFVNAPAVAVVDDRRDVATPPAKRTTVLSLYFFDGTLHRQITRALALPRQRRALGVNALDEVPDSTWFTNRIGVRDLGVDEVRRGPVRIESPEAHLPWTIVSSKVGGLSIGFILVDARGERFLLKFDGPHHPEIETAAEVIMGRLLWAIGYNVAEDHVVYFRPDELRIAPDAMVKTVFGGRRRLDRAQLDRQLAGFERTADGRLRAMASRMIAGTPLGGHAAEGVRGDDPNDRIPHELRRDLRGLYAVFAWLDHEDIKEDNTLDMWVEDPGRSGHHYVRHYWVDFGLGLGTSARHRLDRRRGHEYALDFARMAEALITLGLWRRRWEDRDAPALRGVGLYDVASFDPGAWKPMTPSYIPFLTADRFDQLWSAKIIMRFTREQLRAAVEAGRLSDPRAADHLVDALVARQRATGRYWFRRVSPLDGFEVIERVEGALVCFDDLLLTHRLEPAAGTRYQAASHDRAGRALGAAPTRAAEPSGRTCAGPLPLAPGGDGYTIVRLITTRPDVSGATSLHLARPPGTGALRVIGVWRE